MSNMGNGPHRHHGPWATWATANMDQGQHERWATWPLGNMGDRQHGRWATWAMGNMGHMGNKKKEDLILQIMTV